MPARNSSNLTVESQEAPPATGKNSAAESIVKREVKAGETCFVMQPFAPPHWDYYDSIYVPAIRRTGLTPVRADDARFGTGIITEQIRRGIMSAKVLVAELSTRNANVMYEVGLAHGLNKQVVLISNQADVPFPFDVNHIRVVQYNTADPFWGATLIDKIADRITHALKHPEEPIFQTPDSGRGKWRMDFFPYEENAMFSTCGERVQDYDARLHLALEGVRRADVHPDREQALVFGPYRSLPSRGRFVTKFSLKLDEASDVLPDEPILRVDVHDREGETNTLAQHIVTGRELPRGIYTLVPLEFDYFDLRQILEYRVLLLSPRVRVRCDYIFVEPCTPADRD